MAIKKCHYKIKIKIKIKIIYLKGNINLIIFLLEGL